MASYLPTWGGGAADPQLGTTPPSASVLAGAAPGPAPGAAVVAGLSGDALRAACARPAAHGTTRSAAATTLYLQIYDEASRPPAVALREALQAAAGDSVQVAPIENVVRSAELRQQRRAVPWPKPTFVLHDPSGGGCAAALGRFVGAPWVEQQGDADAVWIRGLPRRLQATPGVIELWLPPMDMTVSALQNGFAPRGDF